MTMNLTLLQLPVEILVKILSPIPESEIFWNVGFTCKRLLDIALSMIRVIELDLDLKDIKDTRNKIKKLYARQEVINNVSHLVICQDFRKNAALYQNINTRNGTILLVCGRLELLTEGILIHLMNQNLTLQSLYIIGYIHITERILTRVGKYYSNLYTLDLAGCVELNDCGVIIISNCCKHLASVCFRDCCNITDEAIIHVTEKSGSNLRSLNLRDCEQLTSRSMISIGRNCPNLFLLDISWCRQVSEDGIVAVGEHCVKLEKLFLRGANQLSTEGLIILANNCKALKELYLWGCFRIEDDAIRNLADKCLYLERLELWKCFKLTDEGVIYLSEKCRSLKHLNLRGCFKLTNVSVISIARHCNLLEELNLRGLYEETDMSIEWVAKSCKNLREIDFTNCPKVTSESIRHLVRHCQHLKKDNFENGPIAWHF